ncbi:TlpA disulfide reductase family protein [Dysgonomonas sp. BGC7]|uniref:TlpA disulfide reductase family protein n=1 Tax=Dysgonomonas sp. BGC7 TaxID=1658008 RepID=UPI000A4DEA5B|nr:TlpA disulfide reductase family protein [Dysgonomonas sp. BGC7]MBD8390148.1 AhpC/TSA family protein [Dysgonomonas sp. BGC7]
MKRTVFILVGIILMSACKEKIDTYVVSAKLSEVKDSTKIYMRYMLGDSIKIDSTYINQGAFEFKSDYISPFRATIFVNHENKAGLSRDVRDYQDVYVEKGLITIEGTDSIKNAIVSGTKSNELKKEWVDFSKVLTDKRKLLYSQYYGLNDTDKTEDVKTLYKNKFDSLRNEEKLLAQKFSELHYDSFFALDALFRTRIGYDPDANEADSLFQLFSKDVKDSYLGQDFSKKITIWKSTSIGQQSPDFSQNDVNGNPIKLSDYKGKYVLIDFWASWCGPCRHENPHVVKAFNEYKDKGFTILGVSLDDKKEDWLKAIEADGLAWAQVSDLKGWKNEVAQNYAVSSIPTNYLLDTSGKIIAKNLRGDALKEALGKYLDNK